MLNEGPRGRFQCSRIHNGSSLSLAPQWERRGSLPLKDAKIVERQWKSDGGGVMASSLALVRHRSGFNDDAEMVA